MAYFFKKSNYKTGTYLQIYESFYNPERKGGAHRSYKALGYVHEFQAKGIEGPISFYQEEVIPKLFDTYGYSLNQLYDGLEYINLTRATTFIKKFASLIGLPLTSYFLSDGEIKKMLSHRF